MKAFATTLSLLLLLASAAWADDTVIITSPESADAAPDDGTDRHTGYYYPAPETAETYIARGPTIAQANRGVRVAFITSLEVELSKRGNPIPYAVFAKGTEAQKMIIVAMMDGPMDTLYRARAVLANLTAESRLLPLLKKNGVDDWFTFFDVAVLLGFEQITISDGKTWAHRVELKPPY